jgi:hypothetical protein
MTAAMMADGISGYPSRLPSYVISPFLPLPVPDVRREVQRAAGFMTSERLGGVMAIRKMVVILFLLSLR